MPATIRAQPTGTDDPSEEYATNTENTDPASGEPGETILPADIETRESFDPAGEEQPQMNVGIYDYVRVFLSLAIVVAVIWGISVLFKKFVTVRGLATTSESLKVLYTMSLSPTRTLYLVRLGDRILLIGAGDGGMRTLSEITEPEEVAGIIREVEFKGNFDMNPFRDRLQGLLGENEPSPDGNEEFGVRQKKLKATINRLKQPEKPE